MTIFQALFFSFSGNREGYNEMSLCLTYAWTHSDLPNFLVLPFAKCNWLFPKSLEKKMKVQKGEKKKKGCFGKEDATWGFLLKDGLVYWEPHDFSYGDFPVAGATPRGALWVIQLKLEHPYMLCLGWTLAPECKAGTHPLELCLQLLLLWFFRQHYSVNYGIY